MSFVASFLSVMSVGGGETRAWEPVKEGPGWGVLVARHPTDQSRMLIGLCVCVCVCACVRVCVCIWREC